MYWNKLGINYGHVTSAYTNAQIISDLTLFKAKGINKLRLAISSNKYVSQVNVGKNIAQIALDMDFKVIYGIGVNAVGAGFTGAEWTTYLTVDAPAFCVWAESMNNANLSVSFGNEFELSNTGDSAPDDATVVSDIGLLATDMQSVYTKGDLLYSTPINTDVGNLPYAQWVTTGKGGLDKLGINVHTSLPTLITTAELIASDWGDAGFISEFSDQSGFTTTNSESQFTQNVRDRLVGLMGTNISEAYFFCFNHTTNAMGLTTGQWNLLLEDYVTLRDAFQELCSGRRWYINS